MKRFLSIIMLIAMLLTLCACAKKDETTAADSAETSVIVKDELNMSPEELYGDIDQTQPIDGVYKIWSIVGIQQLTKHPDATFEVLCHIDLEGAVLAPVPEFTGEIVGGNWTIKNFTVQGDGESFGLIAVNKGIIRNLTLEDVTFQPGSTARNIGSLAGTNEGTLNRCVVSGTMEVVNAAADAACGSVVGVNTGSITNTAATVDLVYSAAGTANVGGIVGVAKGGKIEYTESHGVLTVTGDNKITGLFAGSATDVIFKSCVFGGADNSLDGKLFTNFTGNPDDDELVVAEEGRWRDNACIEPLPENVRALREKVVKAMYDIKSITWTVTNDRTHSCTCQLATCHGTYSTGYTYQSVPYNHKMTSYKKAMYCLNEDNTLKDWVYELDAFDGYDIYFGTDCSGAVQMAWWSVSNSTNIRATDQIMPAYGNGTIAVGDYKCDFQMTTQTRDGVTTLFTAEYLEANTEQAIYEAYADTHLGDIMVSRIATGGHTRMVAAEPVVIRDQAGNIDPVYSYVLMHDQGGEHVDNVNKIITFGKINWKFTFAELYGSAYLPVTCEELITGEMEPVEATLEGACEGFGGMFTGTVKANYQLDAVTLTIRESDGNIILDHPLFVTAQKNNDYGNNYYTGRNYTDSYDLSNFATVMTRVPLEQGKTYSYTITANLATFDNIVVHEGEFTYG